MHLVDIAWRAKKDTIRPYLLGWKSSTLVREPLSIGEKVSWRVEGPQRCIGYRNEKGERQACPEGAIVYQNKTSCGPCTAIDYTDVCMRCNGSDCLATEARLEECRKIDYAVYIAIFGEQVKVGVSSLRRVRIRWIEQGADYGAILMRIKGGDHARLVENQVGRMESIVKSVRTSQKMSRLQEVITIQDAKRKIREIAMNVIKPTDFDERIIEALSSYYGFSVLDRVPEDLTKAKQLDSLYVVGEILGIKGPILVLSYETSYLALDMRKLRGYSIIEDPDASIITQSGLDEFL